MDTGTIIKQSLLKKVKPKLKLKYFVLHKDGKDLARLEYFDSLKDWEKKKKPKRVICLKSCFSINAFSNSKVKNGLTLFTKDDCFQIAYECDDDRDSWLMTMRALISTHRDARPMFQHVWNVVIRERDLGKTYIGEYRLCLNDRTVMFVKKACIDPTLVFPVEVIRRCGHTDNFFKLEVGRQASTGPGEFWMEVDDGLIAENVHQAIISAVNKPKEQGEGDLRSQIQTKSGRRGKSGQSTRRDTFSSTGGNRSRSDSVDSRSYAGSAAFSNSDTISITTTETAMSAALSISDCTDSTTLCSVNGNSTIGSGSRTPSRSMTPTRSATPDSRLPELPAAVGPTHADYLAMTPAVLTSDVWMKPKSNSPSLSSVNSLHSGKESAPEQSAYADMRQVTPTPRPNSVQNNSRLSHIAAVADDYGSYADMGPATKQSAISVPNSLPYTPKNDNSISSQSGGSDNPYLCMTPSPSAISTCTGLVRSSSSLSNKKPERTQSFIAQVQPAESSPYLEMSPGVTGGGGGATSSSPYLDMKPVNLPGNDSNYLDMAPIGSSRSDTGSIGRPSASPHPIPVPQSSPYMDMAPQSSSLSSSPYMDMTPGRSSENVMSSSFQGLSMTGGNNKHQYVDMTGSGSHRTSSLSVQDDNRRIDHAKSYVSSENVDIPPTRHYSVGSRPNRLQKAPINDQYVEMRRQDLNDKKSLSVPHLIALSLASNPDLTHLQEEYPANYPVKPELMMLNFDRPRTSSETYSQRPRGNTWSQNTRPRAASHGQKAKPTKKMSIKSSSSRESVRSTTSASSDYVDMQSGRSQQQQQQQHGVSQSPHFHPGSARSKSMHNRKNSHPGAYSHGVPVPHVLNISENNVKSRLSPPKLTSRNSSQSNSFDGYLEMNPGFLPDEGLKHPAMIMIGRRMSQPHPPIDPFPELSASSEEDVSMRSGASSFSSTKSSSSSRSSLARGEDNPHRTSYLYGAGLDPDAYVECQQVSVRGGSHQIHGVSKLPKPARVASFISEETDPTGDQGASSSQILTKADKNKRNKKRTERQVATPPPNTKAADPYMEMAPKRDSRQSSPATRLATPPQIQQTRPPSATISKPKQQVVPVVTYADPYMEMYPNQTALPPKPSQLPNTLEDNYTDMAPVNMEVIRPQLVTPVRTVPPTTVLSTGASYDPYMMMDTPEGQSSCTATTIAASDPLNTMALCTAGTEGSTYSDSSTLASSEVTQLTVGTGSSDDSNQTLQQDETEIKPPPLKTQFSIHTTTKHKNMKPNNPPCWIRQNSQDTRKPDVPSAPYSYIRSDSTLSQLSTEGYPLAYPASPNNQNSILDMLACVAQGGDTEDDYGPMSFEANKGSPQQGVGESDPKPISPILLPSAFDSGQTPNYTRSSSECSDIPGSAAELNQQMLLQQQQRPKLDQVKEEETPSCTAASNSALKSQQVISFIVDDKPDKPSVSRQRSNKVPPPAPPLRSISVEGKSSRSSSSTEPPTPTPENQPIIYATITHDPGQALTKPEYTAPVVPLPTVDYTPIDHPATEEARNKKSASSR